MGQSVCKANGIDIVQRSLDIDEVQSENPEYVARRKAEAAFAELEQPALISDDSWNIHGLNGFPGTYAKSVNAWFSPDDFLRLTKDLEDRSVSITQFLVYTDGKNQQLFSHTTTGTLLTESCGEAGASIQKVISFVPDNRSMSQTIDDNSFLESAQETLHVWHEFIAWIKGQS